MKSTVEFTLIPLKERSAPPELPRLLPPGTTREDYSERSSRAMAAWIEEQPDAEALVALMLLVGDDADTFARALLDGHVAVTVGSDG